jgi:2'-5' RNA ligase
VTSQLEQELRLFVAIELSEDVCQALGALQQELRNRGLDRLRWVRPEGIHLTLKFLGETPIDRLPAIKAALAPAVEGVPPHELFLGRLGTFGGRNPRVVWVSIEGDVGPLKRLHDQVETAMEEIGFPPEGRDFRPHLTLGRVRPEGARQVARALEEAVACVAVPAMPIVVRELSLMQSRLGPGGAVYTRLKAYPLV